MSHSPTADQAYPSSKEKEELQTRDDAFVPSTAKDAVKNINKSPGVVRIEAINAAMTRTDRIFIFIGVFLVAYAYSLDGTLRYAYQPYALGEFDEHSLQASVNVLRAVIACAAQPTAAKIADVFGRVELIVVSVFFYILGTIIEATCHGITAFAAGAVIYQIGFTMIILLVEVIIADITSTRARLFFSYIPATPFIINAWASGDVSEAVLKATTWRWGIGMWCIIYTACALPLIVSLQVVAHKAKKQGLLDNWKSSFQSLGAANFAIELFWLLDVVGIILLIAVLALLLVPLTIAGGFASKWKEAHVIAPLVIGFLCIPGFVFWELRAPHPLAPFHLMKDRAIWAPLGIACFLNFSWAMQADFLFTVLRVSFDFTNKSATRIISLYSFTSVIVGTVLGLIVYKVKRLKYFMVFGTFLFMVAFGLLIRFRGESNGSSRSGVIGAQVVLGFAGGMFPYPAQASLQAFTKHENLAVMTGIYLALYNIGSALGNAVSGAVWSQVGPPTLEKNLAGINDTLAAITYGNPLSIVDLYPMGTPERDAIVKSYMHIQRLLCIVGICLTIPLIVFACLARNAKLNDEQTLASDDEAPVKRRVSVA